MANLKPAILFQALGDPTRREIFERLVKGPQAVVDLSAGLRVSRPAVSQHLKVLKDAGLVLLEQRGTRHLYQLAPEGVTAMRDYLDRLWDAALVSFKAAAEKAQKGEK
ncbi:MAG TPA: metalloregulator ArsR/SmtB family transcription factor [bacterium]|nr:metalloregulator ArsR/SmtB family transcription factor [bacterium]